MTQPPTLGNPDADPVKIHRDYVEERYGKPKGLVPRFPDVTVEIEDGNAVAIMNSVTKALRDAGYEKAVEPYLTQARSGDYNNVLSTTQEYVNVT